MDIQGSYLTSASNCERPFYYIGCIEFNIKNKITVYYILKPFAIWTLIHFCMNAIIFVLQLSYIIKMSLLLFYKNESKHFTMEISKEIQRMMPNDWNLIAC